MKQHKMGNAHFVGTSKEKGKRKKTNELKNEAANVPT